MNKKNLFKFLTFILVLCISLFVSKLPISAGKIITDNGTNYDTLTISPEGLTGTQTAYVVKNEVSKFRIKGTTEYYKLVNPCEMYYDKVDGFFYIVDKGSTKKGEEVAPSIVRVTKDFSEAEILNIPEFKEPQGVYVVNTKVNDVTDNLIYVADYAAQKVFILDYNGNKLVEYGKPIHPLYGESMLFKPSKIVVDHVGTMYIVDAGNANGLVQLTSDGEFLGYFGANYTDPDMSYIIKFMFSTKKQREKLYRQPISPTNMAIDNDGLINTITKNLGPIASLKRLNIAGDSLLNPQYPWASDSLVDISIGGINNIYTIDEDGWIYEYDVNGDLLFLFGGPDNSGTFIGLFVNPQAIEVDENYQLYVIDNGAITTFVPTKYCEYVHEAIDLYQNGLYAKSREPWENVLQLNNMSQLAHRGIGKSFLIEQDYEQALYHFELAGDTAGYSDAYWELRNEWLNNSIGYIVGIILAIVIVYYILKFLEKKNKLISISYIKEFINKIKLTLSKVRFLRELGYVFNFLKHPLDSFYEVKKHNKVSFLTGVFLYILLFIELVLAEVYTGFIFNPIDVETISIASIFTSSILIILLFVICHYLIASIVQGNGTFKNVFVSTICSFAPVMVFLPIIVLVSNFLTLNESFIYQFGTIAIWGWSFILLFFMIKETQELEVGETIVNILLTVLTMILFVAFGFLLYALTDQIVGFVVDVVMEVISNG